MKLQKSDTSSLAESSSGDSDVINHNSKNVSAKPKQPFLCFGLMCCILSGLFFSVNALMVKMVKSIGPIQMLGARCWVQFVILLPFVMYNWKIRGVDFIGPTKSFKLLLLRSLTGSSAAMIFYQSIARLPLGDAVTLMFSSIVFVHIFAFFFLHERPTVLDIFFSVVILVGVVFIAKPPFIFDSATVYDTARLYGTLFGVLAASLAALTFVIVRKLGIATHCSLNVLYYSFVGSLTSLIFTPTIEGF
uniref:EamA domain-containing protein n=1 Tax=Ciona savignyi TaxID=51511 RepID=H2ZJU3_CIOSA